VNRGRPRVTVNRQPLVGSQRNLRIGFELVVSLDDMDVLNSEGIARPQHGAGVVLLIDVGHNHGDPAGPPVQHFLESVTTLRRQELLEMRRQRLLVISHGILFDYCGHTDAHWQPLSRILGHGAAAGNRLILAWNSWLRSSEAVVGMTQTYR
jgi:hypothetical protein